jgi:CRISPR-associated endonuclease/helicase Cas3
MLADVGAGTIDQALLAVLPSKFNTVRLFGLSDKVLVIDEAHAYDEYMGVELEQLLRFHAALGGCAVVLSATLPKSRRNTLVDAWRDGLRGGQRRLGPATEIGSMAYPLATVVGTGGVQEVELVAASWSGRCVPVRFVHDLESARSHVLAAARAGACVVWVRNTVEDCLAAADMVRENGLEPIVFHARFAQSDRQRREQEVLGLFGPGGSPERRRGRVVVATQVIEQSLDLDFDAMVTDIAPVDLLIQRAGRLQRHSTRHTSRPHGLALELVVLSPPFLEEPGSDWLEGIFAGTAAIYEDAGLVWRTVRSLERARAIVMPGDLRTLIEGVYGSDDVPEGLTARANRAEGKGKADAATATFATLIVTDGYAAGARAWASELRVPTRIHAKQVAVRLARLRPDGALVPWSDGEPAWRAWALSEVQLSSKRVRTGSMVEARLASAASAARRTWGRFEQEIPVLPLEPVQDGSHRGVLVDNEGRVTLAARYIESSGLVYEDRR